MNPNDLDLRAALRSEADPIDVTGDLARGAIALNRRRTQHRVIGGAVAAAAAVALAVPLLWSGYGTGEQPVPASSTSQVPSVSSTQVPGSTAPTTLAPEPPRAGPPPTYDSSVEPVLSVSPKLGPATGVPDVPYAVDGVLHDGDRTVPLPYTSGYAEIWRLAGGGALVHPGFSMDEKARVIDAAGKSLASFTTADRPYANAEGTRIAWVDSEMVVHVLDAQGTELTRRSGIGRPSTMAGDIVYAQGGPEGSTTTEWNTVTGETRTFAGRVYDVDEARGRALVMPPQDYDPSNTCYQMLDLKTEKPSVIWKACGTYAPMAFSSGGSYILGTYTLDGAGPNSLALASAEDGRVLLSLTPDGTGAWSYRMNADETAVVFSYLDTNARKEALVRCTLDGKCAVVGEERTANTSEASGGFDGHWAQIFN
jgi:hypothetical protein